MSPSRQHRHARAFTAIATLFALAACDSPANSEAREYTSEQHAFRLVAVSDPLDHPWGMTFLPDGRILVTEKAGKLRIVGPNGKVSAPLSGLPKIREHGQGGLLDVALHPDFASNRRIYLSHAADVDGAKMTALTTARLEGGRLIGARRIFTGRPGSRAGQHFGSRLRFGTDGKLYMTIGDRGYRPGAQDLGTHAGVTLRLNDDGSAPADNPFARRSGARAEIWSYGHRNQQGLAIDNATGRIWAHEHGPRGGDEVNVVKRGANYGWPVITYGRNYSGTTITDETARAGMEQPKTYWVPSIAPSGLTFYDGDKFSQWKGNLFVGALRARLLARLTLDGDKVVGEERLLTDFDRRIRDVRTGPDGLIYLLLDEGEAPIWRIEPR